jgi:hypothetical protein
MTCPTYLQKSTICVLRAPMTCPLLGKKLFLHICLMHMFSFVIQQRYAGLVHEWYRSSHLIPLRIFRSCLSVLISQLIECYESSRFLGGCCLQWLWKKVPPQVK